MQAKETYVHIGLPKSASTYLQQEVFQDLPGIKYIGKNGSDKDLNRNMMGIVRTPSVTFRGATLKEEIYRKYLRQNDKVLYSEEDLSIIKFVDPVLMASRLLDIFGSYRVLLITRNPLDYLRSLYYFRLSNYDPTTFQGMDHWLTLNRYPFCVGSDLGGVFSARILSIYEEISGNPVTVIPYETLKHDKGMFGDRLGEFLDLDQDQLFPLLNKERGKIHKLRVEQGLGEHIKKLQYLLGGQFKLLEDYLSEHLSSNIPEEISKALEKNVSEGNQNLKCWKEFWGKLYRYMDFADHVAESEVLGQENLNWVRSVTKNQVSEFQKKNFGRTYSYVKSYSVD